jgi:choline kinase
LSYQKSISNERITTAVLLAAGTGSRLFPLTKSSPKCLTMVNDVSMLERLTSCLQQHGFKRLVIVTGHLEECIRDFLGSRKGDMEIEYVFSPLYKTTNNIYSLWMVRQVINEPFVLLESDLIFDPSLLAGMLYPDRIAVAPMRPCLNGSMVTLSPYKKVEAFHSDVITCSTETKYKTVNIYSLSLASWHAVVEKLNQYIAAGKVNMYYEIIFGQMIAEKTLSLQAIFFDNTRWYEVDDLKDLALAERMFASSAVSLPKVTDTLAKKQLPVFGPVVKATH